MLSLTRFQILPFAIVAFFVSLVALNASAAPVPFFAKIGDGRTQFDDQVNDASGTIYTQTLSGLTNNTNSWTLPDFTITSTNNANRGVDTVRLNPAPGALPGGDGINMSADGSVTSGLTFTFGSAINGFGIELDDWATCCYPSSLYISFDGGTPILIGTANSASDNPGQAESNTTFIGAIDDSGTFTVVTFYGTGNGDALWAGGIIRYAIVPLGSISGGGGGYVETAAPTPSSGLAEYLDQHDDSGTLQTVANYLDTASASEVDHALKTIFPVNTGATSETMMSASSSTANVLIDKVGTVLGNTSSVSSLNFSGGAGMSAKWLLDDIAPAGGGTSYGIPESDLIASLAASPYQKFGDNDHAFWLEGVAAGANGSDTATTLGYDTNSYGVVAGYEMALDKNHLVGLVTSIFRSDVNVDDHAGKTEANNYNMGIYGQKLAGATKLTGVATVGYGDYNGERHVDVGGVTASPESDYNGWSLSLSAAVSRLYTQGQIKIEPFALVSYTAVKTDGYSEKNGGAFNMTVDGDSFSTATIKTGVTFRHETEINNKKLQLQLRPYVGYQQEIEGSNGTVSLAGSGSATTINGRDLSTPILGLATEIKYELSEQTSLKGGIDLTHEEDEDRYMGFVGVGVKF